MAADRDVNVVHVLDSLAPGGLENGVVNVARKLNGDGFQIHAACPIIRASRGSTPRRCTAAMQPRR